MKIDTYGDSKNPVALLIHGIFYPGVTSYRSILPILEKKYYIIVPNLDGLSYPKTDFVSARKQGERIIEWLKENNISHIHFLLGSSFGSSVAFEILKDVSLSIDKAVLDSPALKESKLHGMILYFEMKRTAKDFRKNGINAFKHFDKYRYFDSFDKEYCLKVYNTMDDKTLKELAFSCYRYRLPSELYRDDTEIKFIFGEKDKSKANLPEVKELKSGEIKIVEGMSHLQYMFEKPTEFLHECGVI
ncbi:alpha/beta fold hydrolase [Peptostreptococcus sp. D1]|uniref:alpha/beta fold hydrolase n=1 Tax=Peptostreptococcus sp. D1 TaxID=72304 RepID=UPI0008F2F3B6|nr:alpha/beta hydrolase [Peptostreptococcus sp. D1]SFE44518.1 Pimeloyl-ACP methyl ester carboxylesterase [Peptostreptococcus sp. D1]